MQRRGQGTFEYTILLGGIILVVILSIVILRSSILSPANQQIAGSVGVLTNITNASAALALIATPTPTPPPTVMLTSPANGGSIPWGVISFAANLSGGSNLSSATLYGNFTGSWAANVSNTTPIANNSIYTFNVTVLPGNYTWNVYACDPYGSCAFAPANYNLTLQPMILKQWTFTSDTNPSWDYALSLTNDQNGALYLSATQFLAGPEDWNWLVEKVNATTGTIMWNYTNNPSPNSDYPRGIAYDPSGFVYALGHDSIPGFQQGEIRVEKINVTSGAKPWTYTLDVSPNYDAMENGWFDPVGALYLAGYDSTGANVRFRAQKLNTTTGTNMWTYVNNTGPGDDIYDQVALGNNGLVYFAGVDSGGIGGLARIDALNATTGTLNWTYTFDPSVGPDAATGVVFDPAGYVYWAGYDFVPGNYERRTEKLYANNGTKVWTYVSNPTPGNDTVGRAGIAFNPIGVLYTYGLDGGGDGSEIRVEKINATTGANMLNYTENRAPGTDYTNGITIDPAGTVYISGTDLGGAGGEIFVEKLAG